MKYSIIFCYRNREEHLQITVPALRTHFLGLNIEIIVVEQADNGKFRRGTLFNEGAKIAKGDYLIFHDIDHVPSSPETAYLDKYGLDGDVFLPLKRVEFVMNDFSPRFVTDIPKGYLHYKNSVDDNYWGGINTFKRDAFFKINGFSPSLVGWGLDDSILRDRALHYGLTWSRSNTNLHYALYHQDSGPANNDPDFAKNSYLAYSYMTDLENGVGNQVAKSVEVPSPHPQVDKWLKSSNFEPHVETHIVATILDD